MEANSIVEPTDLTVKLMIPDRNDKNLRSRAEEANDLEFPVIK